MPESKNKPLILTRQELLFGAAAAAGSVLLGCGAEATTGMAGDLDDLEILDEAQAVHTSTTEATPQCEETEDNLLGPFYLPNAPFRDQLAEPGEGIPLAIVGRVASAGSACTPIPSTLLDVWQANGEGEYDNTGSYRLRGRLYSDAEGQYRFDTIVPGRYLDGAQFRPRHIHLRASAPAHRELTTQIYFRGDRYLATDRFVKDSLVIPVYRTRSGFLARFDINLVRT